MRAMLSPRRLDAAVFLACAAFALYVTWTHGADLNWDMQNYHLYSAFAFLTGRLGTEFMEAGIVTYLNPLPMLPFYGMVAAGWHSLAIGVVLGLAHALNLVLLWLICRRLLGARENGTPLALLALVIGAASPIFIAEIGTSYADITTCTPVLGGVLLLLGAQTRGRLLAAGLLLGVAVGLKLTNMPFAVAAAALVFVPGVPWRRQTANLWWLILGGVIGGVLAGGYWAWLLYREFHNPVFPFANAVFRSPDFPVVGHIHRRFLPTSLQQVFAFPFSLALPKNWIYTEVFAPDMRFALCTAAGAAALVTVLHRALARRVVAVPAGDGAWLRFLAYVALAWTLWLMQFANGRYFLPLSLLIGPALVVVLAAMLPARRAVLTAFLCALLQIVQMHVNGVTGYGETGRWNARWVELDMPRQFVDKPYLFLSLSIQSHSYLAAYVHPRSRFMNVDGMVPLDVVGPGGERVRQQLAAFEGATRMLTPLGVPLDTALKSKRYIGSLNADLNRFGLLIDLGDCAVIVNRSLRESLRVQVSGEAASDRKARPLTLLSCALKRTPPLPELQASRARAAALLDKIELACPRQFPTRWDGVVMRSKDGFFWSRHYVDTDLWMLVGDTQVYAQHPRFDTQSLGTPEGLMNGSERVPCDRIRWHAPPSLSLEPVTSR